MLLGLLVKPDAGERLALEERSGGTLGSKASPIMLSSSDGAGGIDKGAGAMAGELAKPAPPEPIVAPRSRDMSQNGSIVVETLLQQKEISSVQTSNQS